MHESLFHYLNSNDTSFYVDGFSRKYGPGCVHLNYRKGIWKQSPISGSFDFKACLNVEYKPMNLNELESWIKNDFKQYKVLREL